MCCLSKRRSFAGVAFRAYDVEGTAPLLRSAMNWSNSALSLAWRKRCKKDWNSFASSSSRFKVSSRYSSKARLPVGPACGFDLCGCKLYSFPHLRECKREPRLEKAGWVFLTGVAAGAGIWATHFVAMLAFKTGLPTAYDPTLTLASLLIAISVTAAGFFVAGQGKNPLLPAIGGAVIGLGIGTMHYTGMRAYLTTGTVSWDGDLVLASIALGVLFAAVALVSFHRRSRTSVTLAAAGLLTIAICSLHFTAMGAAIITPDPTIIVYPSFMDNSTMALSVAGVTLLVMLAGLAAALIEKQTARESVVRLHELADAAAEGIVVAKDGEIINVNQRISEITGWTGNDMLGKKVFGDLLVASRQPRHTLGDRPIETLMITAAGEAIPVEVIWKPYRSGLRANEVYAVRDLQERRRAEETIRHLAHYESSHRTSQSGGLEATARRNVSGRPGGRLYLCGALPRFGPLQGSERSLWSRRRRSGAAHGRRPDEWSARPRRVRRARRRRRVRCAPKRGAPA